MPDRHNDQHGVAGEQQRHSHGSECRPADIFTPLPCTDAREQCSKWIQESKREQDGADSSNPAAINLHA